MVWRAVSRVLRSPRNIASTLACDILTSVFPGDCRVCGGPLLFALNDTRVACPACIARLTPQRGLLCHICGEALGMESERFAAQSISIDRPLCSPCRLAPPAFTRAVAYGVYQDELRQMIHLLKYEGMRSIAPILAPRLAVSIATLTEASPSLLVIAVPLFPAKQRQRGYNQAILLADESARILRKQNPARNLEPAHTLLRRLRDTESQFSLTPHARRKNLRGAFVVANPARLQGREVLLIDDIFTTGATTRECARVLIAAGATKVWVATLARAQTEGIALWNPVSSHQVH